MYEIENLCSLKMLYLNEKYFILYLILVILLSPQVLLWQQKLNYINFALKYYNSMDILVTGKGWLYR